MDYVMLQELIMLTMPEADTGSGRCD